MKKFLFIAIAFIAFQTSNAQSFAKGDTFVEGTVSFVSGDSNETFNFNPAVGYFVTDKVTVGVELDTQSTKNAAGVKTSDSFGVGVFARCYFLKIGEHLNVYSQLGLGTSDDKVTDVKSTDVRVGLGANYFVTKNLSLTLKLAELAKYSSVKTGDVSANETSIGFNGVTNPFTTPTFGLSYRF
jgi:outer membrane protein